MRALALLVALAAADVCGASRPSRDVDRPDLPAPAFALLPGGTGAGTSHVHTNLDQLFPGEMVGNWWALRGDGTTAGPVALSLVGSPTSQVDRVCPNGPDCAPVTSQRTASGSYFATAAAGWAPSTFSVCALLSIDSIGTLQRVVAKDDGTKRSFYLAVAANGAPAFGVFGAAGTAAPAAGSVTAGSWTFLCGTYQDGSTKLYVDGTNVGTSTTSTGAILSYADTRQTIAANNLGTESLTGRIALAFLTEKVLSQDTLTAMASAVLPSVQGSRGEAVTTTRSTVRACCSGASCSMLPANRACAQGATVDVTGSWTNLVQQYNAVNAAPWSTSGTPTISADSVIGPFGTKTADQITVDGPANATASVQQSISGGTAGASYVPSFWIKRESTTGMLAVANPAASANGWWKIDLSKLGTGWNWITAAHPAVTVANPFTYYSTGIGGVVFRSDVSGAITVDLDGIQVENGSVAHPPCPTTTSAQTCAADRPSVATSADWPVASGTLELSYTPSGVGSGNRAFIDTRPNASDGYVAYINGLDQLVWQKGGTPASSTALTWTPGQRYRIRFVWGDGVVSAWRDEVPVIIGASIADPTAISATAAIGQNTDGSTPANGTISDLRVSR